MDERPTPGQYAQRLRASCDRLVAFVVGCPEDAWRAAPLAPGDPRPVGVIADHVADAYGYLGGWVQELLAGGSPTVSGELVDGLNARHAAAAAGVTRHAAAHHLEERGDALAGLIGGVRADDMELGEGRLRRLVEIAIRHTDDHHGELVAAVSQSGA